MEITDLKSELKTKAAQEEIKILEKELALKTTTALHSELISVVDGLQTKLEDAEKTQNSDQTVVRLLIKEKASAADLNQLQVELKNKLAEDFDKLAYQIREKGNSAEFNERISDILNDVQEKATKTEIDESMAELR